MRSKTGNVFIRRTARDADLPITTASNRDDSNNNEKYDDDDEKKKKKLNGIFKLWWIRQKPIFLGRIKRNAKLNNIMLALFALILFIIFESRHDQDLFEYTVHSSSRKLCKGRRELEDPPLPILFESHRGSGRYVAGNIAFPMVSSLPPIRNRRRDYGGIEFVAPNMGENRNVQHEYREGDAYSEHRDPIKSSYVGRYYAFDDDYLRGRSYEFHDRHTCRRNSWHRLYSPACNKFHEVDPIWDPSAYLSKGHYRTVWGLQANENEVIALKLIRDNNHDFNTEFYEFTRNDALVMERLTSSPRIADIYGHCATSVMTEVFVKEIEKFLVPGSGYISQEELNDKKDVNPQNKFTATEKLEMALAMSEAIADLHGYEGGVIVHDDIQPCQFLHAADGSIKLNDFNRAEVMLYDEEHERYCRYRNGKVYGNYRAPEEDSDGNLNEKIDIYSLGNNFYGLLTGLWVYYTTEDDEVVQKNVIKGTLPYIDDRYRTRSYAEGQLVKIMERCWATNPDERADIFEVVKFLRAAIVKNSQFEKKEQKRSR